LELGEFDVVIGNPPWLEAGDQETDSDTIKLANRHAVGWSEAFGLPVGDRSYSQLFIHRALSLLKPGGTAGLLVSAKVIWNQRETSKRFRRYWLDHAHIREIINFAHARRIFFDNAVAPFIFVRFDGRLAGESTGFVVYWSARLTRAAQQLRSVVFTRTDRRLVHQDDLRTQDFLWKTYWWGSHRDAALVARLSMEDTLLTAIRGSSPEPGYGFQRSGLAPSQENRNLPGEKLASLPELVSERITWYGQLRPDWFDRPPSAVKRQPDPRLYEGQRLLLTTGIKAFFGPCVRLENDSFSFRHTMYCVPLSTFESWQAKVVLGTIWSALGRYYLFMTSGSWGGWFDKIIADDILRIPIRLPDAASLAENPVQREVVRTIVEAVDAIRAWNTSEPNLMSFMTVSDPERDSADQAPLEELLVQLDQSIFKLFDLARSERDLVQDFFTYAFDLLNRGPESRALEHVYGVSGMVSGTYHTLEHLRNSSPQMAEYLTTFLDLWNPELGPDGEFKWTLITPKNRNLIALHFETHTRTEPVHAVSSPNSELAWAALLQRCERVLQQPISGQIYMDQIVRVVTPTSIIVIKRNEQRLWSSTTAREDADASLVQAMQLQTVAEVA
jgi:hypothetical protein